MDELLAQGPSDEPGVLIVDSSLLARRSDLHRVARRVIFVAADDASQGTLGRRAAISIAGLDGVARRRVLEAACLLACTRVASGRIRSRLANRRRDFRKLNRIGSSLMLERDREALLDRIVDHGKKLTQSDVGGMLLAEPSSGDVTSLRLEHWHFDTPPQFEPRELVVAVDDSTIIGKAARLRQPVVIPDVYAMPDHTDRVVGAEFDRAHSYHRKSMLVVPMIDHRDRLVGVLVFINRKSDPAACITSKEDADLYVLPYGDREVSLARSLAGQAAVSIENARLYEQIEYTLESFVKASVTAIDQRDPTMVGHSRRVAALTTGLAAAAEREGRGKYRDLHFTGRQMRELRFAALLHDFGKITVREDVLMKAKKLPPVLWERVDARFAIIRRTVELEHCRTGGDDNELRASLDQLDRMWSVVRDANDPTVLTRRPAAELTDIAARTFAVRDGVSVPYLTEDELHFLCLSQGTLDDEERAEVESHVIGTQDYLAAIPWTEDLGNLVTFAADHHEKLDGSGYPRHLRGDEIPVQARMITLADIFDALTASDRPYKPSVTTERALDIISGEAKAGRLDRELVDIMIQSQAYRRVLEEDWHTL